MDEKLFRAATEAKLGGGSTFDTDANGGVGTRKVLIHPLADLWVFSLSTLKHSVTVNWRNSETFTPPSAFLPGFYPYDGTVVESVAIDSADPNVWFVVVVHGTPPPGDAFGPVVAQGASAVFGPTDIVHGSAEVVQASYQGHKGNVNFYQLSMPGKNAADSAVPVYVALKGATTGTYYAMSQGAPTAGSFMVPNDEVINLVTRNASAANDYTMAGYSEERIPI